MELFLLLLFIAMLCEFIDSSMGMLYGTILSPLLMIFGYQPVDIIPTILVTQALGGFIASYGHHKYGSINITKKSLDTKIASTIFLLGILAVFAGAALGKIIDKEYLKLYIGVLVTLMGIIVISGIKFRFSWKGIYGVAILSSFNKALSGGGFGPVVTAGQIISGRESKCTVGTTTLAEGPICITGFISWVILNNHFPCIELLLPLTIGAIIGGFVGPIALSKFKDNVILTIILGVITSGLGVYTLLW